MHTRRDSTTVLHDSVVVGYLSNTEENFPFLSAISITEEYLLINYKMKQEKYKYKELRIR